MSFAKYEIFRPAYHNNAVTVPSSTCVYENFSSEARNIDYTPSAKKGFEEDETISWSCKKGHRFPDNTDTVISKCQANGTFSHTNLSCSKVTCPHPLEGVQSSPYKLVDNELVRIDQQHAKDDIFLFDDEIVYRCNDTFRSVNA